MADLDYEEGLRALKQELAQSSLQTLLEYYALATDLEEILIEEERYGGDRTTYANKVRALDNLKRFTEEQLGISFTDLCRVDSVSPDVVSSQIAASSPESVRKPWAGGEEIVVQSKTYRLHDPIEETWSADHSVVQRRAKAQLLRVGRIVWLKQVGVAQDTTGASTLREALEREAHLLKELELEGERCKDFPRLLALDATERSLTIAYTCLQRRTLGQVFGPLEMPLDAYRVQVLLQGVHSLCSMLGILHRRNLAHRFLATETVLFAHGGRVVLRDLGLAARAFELGEGPPHYQAPEQVCALEVVPGPRTDIYQLGALLYHILTGHLASLPWQLLPPRTWNSNVPQGVDAVVLRAMATEAQDRWPDVYEFSRALRNACR